MPVQNLCSHCLSPDYPSEAIIRSLKKHCRINQKFLDLDEHDMPSKFTPRPYPIITPTPWLANVFVSHSCRLVPLYVTIPAAAAALAYLDAKSGFWYDRKMMRGAIRATWRHHVRERKNRCNSFYRLEELARDNTVAGRTFLLYNNRSWTYAQAYDMALRYGTYLRDTLGVKSKDIVAIDLHNSDNFVLVMFGLWSIGAKPAFINYNLAGEALTHCIKLAESTLMLVDPDIAHKVDDVVRAQLGDLPIAVLNREFVNKVQAAPATRAPDSCRGGEQGRDMAILIYTSGTTGLPKAAIVSWSKLIVGPCFAMGWLGMESTDTFYTASSTLFLHVVC